jgi:hypothetical protein
MRHPLLRRLYEHHRSIVLVLQILYDLILEDGGTTIRGGSQGNELLGHQRDSDRMQQGVLDGMLQVNINYIFHEL